MYNKISFKKIKNQIFLTVKRLLTKANKIIVTKIQNKVWYNEILKNIANGILLLKHLVAGVTKSTFFRKLINYFFFFGAIVGQMLVFYFVVNKTTFFADFLEVLLKLVKIVIPKAADYLLFYYSSLKNEPAVINFYGNSIINNTSDVILAKAGIFASFFLFFYLLLLLLYCFFLFFIYNGIISKNQWTLLNVSPILHETLSHILWIDHWLFTVPGIEAFIQINSENWNCYVQVLNTIA